MKTKGSCGGWAIRVGRMCCARLILVFSPWVLDKSAVDMAADSSFGPASFQSVCFLYQFPVGRFRGERYCSPKIGHTGSNFDAAS
jgi:hypothetical protein